MGDIAQHHVATICIPADPHLITVAARTGTDIELRIHSSITALGVAAEQWFPAVAGFAVTVLVHTLAATTGRPRYLPPAEPAEWARTIFSTAGASHGYFLGAVDPDTGRHRDGQLAYRLYPGTDRQAIPVPRQVLTCPHYLRSTIDGSEQITIPTTA
ncbi:N-formylglutamate amidohydrolase [Rhodococcus sp. NPDC059968]|uniref:N-formylglutamate amidohydrolase n=1 Tax=Rhodococcus sp. NPDC059968 TaxID=3347017 RepID=UPI0036725348